jgi:hypothetical protein
MLFGDILYTQYKQFSEATSESNNRRHHGFTKHRVDILQRLRTVPAQHVQEAHDVLGWKNWQQGPHRQYILQYYREGT